MSGKTSKLIRRAAIALRARGIVKQDQFKRAIRRVKRDYNKMNDENRVRYKRSLIMIPFISDEETLNKLQGKVS